MSPAITPVRFTRFSIERCICVLHDGEAPALFPVDKRQVEDVLALAIDADGIQRQHLYVLETVGADGETVVMVDHCDGEAYLQVEAGTDANSVVSTGAFGGVCWQVLGFVEGREDNPIGMATTCDARAASEICAGLVALLEPTRVAH